MAETLHLPQTADDAEFGRTIASLHRASITGRDVAQLAVHLAATGELVKLEDGAPVADIASTGGPGSLSTLLGPLFLAAAGFRIVKLTVPGRPAGSIDTLGTIEGYRTRLTTDEVRLAVTISGFAHFLADGRFAPLDAAFFDYRRRTGNMRIPELAMASILSKKVAVGAALLGLDVRVGPHGNFGATRLEARRNIRTLSDAARSLGIKTVAFVSPEVALPQPWIGRGESLLALAHSLGLRTVRDASGWLSDHIKDCQSMAIELGHAATAGSYNKLDWASTESPRDVLQRHLQAQGSSMDMFLQRVDAVADAVRDTILAPSPGVLQLDVAQVREALVAAQRDSTADRFGDPGGLQLLVRPGSYVSEGDAVAVARVEGADPRLVQAMKRSFRVTPNATVLEGEKMEVIHA